MKRQIVVGDIHGELEGLREILLHGEIMDKGENWIGAEAVLIQTGDVIDRGPHSWECIRLLRNLQEQSAEGNGRVVRLCGNHEIMLMQDPLNPYVNYADAEILAAEIREEIVFEKIRASYTDGIRLYTHAGLRSEIREVLEKEIGVRSCGLKCFSDHINEIFKEAVMKNDLVTHPIFHCDFMRGGSHDIGGIFWGDYALISSSPKGPDLPQIFGHTPTRRKGVRYSRNFNLINIDAGMFGGNILYIEIDRSGDIWQHHKKDNLWIETYLGPHKGPPSQ